MDASDNPYSPPQTRGHAPDSAPPQKRWPLLLDALLTLLAGIALAFALFLIGAWLLAGAF